MTRGLQPTLRRVGPADAQALARLAATVAPSVLAGLPADGTAQWAQRLEALAEPADVALGLFSPDGRLQAYAQLRWWKARDRLRHMATLTQLIAAPDRRGKAALATLIEGLLGFTREALAVRRVEVMLDAATAWMSDVLVAAGFTCEATCPGRAAVHGRAEPQWLYGHVAPDVMAFPPAPPLPAPVRARRAKRAERGERAPKFTIRAASELDAEDITAIYTSRGTARGTLQHPWISADVWRERLAQNTRGARVHLVAEVARGARRTLVGSAGIMTVSDDPREKHVASLGIGVMDAWQGVGAGRALMTALLDHADQWAHYARVELHVYADNQRAIALYESLGFKREGVIRDSALREGGYADSIVMGRLHPRLHPGLQKD